MGDKGGYIPPCSWDMGLSLAGGTLFGSGLSGLGVTGFCYGGGVTNYLAAALGEEMQAGVPYYGVAPVAASVANIEAPLLCHLAEHDERVNSTYPAFESALKAGGVPYQRYVYPGTQHGFHNDSTPRYDEAAAKLSWTRTVAHFKRHLV